MSRIYKNIKYACKANNVKLAEIEKPKVSVGFISRHENKGNIENLPIWIFARVSELCSVSIDDLVFGDLYKEAELQEIRAEIERLKARESELTDTEQTDCAWK